MHIINPTSTKRRCEICTASLQWKETKGQGETKRAVYECTCCGHLHTIWHQKLKDQPILIIGHDNLQQTENT